MASEVLKQLLKHIHDSTGLHHLKTRIKKIIVMMANRRKIIIFDDDRNLDNSKIKINHFYLVN
jgi:hypothetical protein